MNAKFVLDAVGTQIVAAPERTIRADQKFRHQEQRQPFGPVGRTGDARQHEMDDVVREVVLPEGDENLAPRNSIRAVPARSARVRSAPTSVPACGSVSSIVPIHSPEMSLGR